MHVMLSLECLYQFKKKVVWLLYKLTKLNWNTTFTLKNLIEYITVCINFILGTNTKSTNLRIHELVIFNQSTIIDAHEEKYFHSIIN